MIASALYVANLTAGTHFLPIQLLIVAPVAIAGLIWRWWPQATPRLDQAATEPRAATGATPVPPPRPAPAVLSTSGPVMVAAPGVPLGL